MILIGLGGNLTCPTFGPPRATCGAALQIMENRGVSVSARSRWYETAPVPVSDQPWYVNGIVAVETTLEPAALVAEVLDIENELGRRRTVANAPRTIDLDVIAHGDTVIEADQKHQVAIPHPRMHLRAFVLLPMREIAPDWRHPASGRMLDDMIADLPADQECRPMAEADGFYGTEWAG
ncbi:MAG: 2-amino-4-hydroxy-6-hydroxymethyldihydropteridine diphosphokinase [Rhodospirillales bacterium]|nr:2-amino-4-hydroxy-6-hydroxymethyldihydropteridine diphosphokinase [Rhodospirillales bacterium]